MAPSEQQHVKEEGNEVICGASFCCIAALRCAADVTTSHVIGDLAGSAPGLPLRGPARQGPDHSWPTTQ